MTVNTGGCPSASISTGPADTLNLDGAAQIMTELLKDLQLPDDWFQSR